MDFKFLRVTLLVSLLFMITIFFVVLYGKRAAQVILADILYIEAVVGDGAFLHVVEAVDEVGDGGFAAPVEPTKAIF